MANKLLQVEHNQLLFKKISKIKLIVLPNLLTVNIIKQGWFLWKKTSNRSIKNQATFQVKFFNIANNILKLDLLSNNTDDLAKFGLIWRLMKKVHERPRDHQSTIYIIFCLDESLKRQEITVKPNSKKSIFSFSS